MKPQPHFTHHWRDNLPGCSVDVTPTPLNHARLLWHNRVLAQTLNLDPALFSGPDVGVFGGEALLPGMQPVAQVYSGHQFGVWAGQLGDGRGLLLGEQRLADGRSVEWHLKGAGLTPFSRMGDGRAVLRSTVREYLACEAMHGLGIPTTRALTIVTSETPVYREQPEPGAMLMRIAESHLRFGHFEHFYYRGDAESVRMLADYTINHYWPQWAGQADRYRLWFEDIADRTARLIAHWQCVGFAHGVMNTDNMSILGLTLDYGPWGFLDDYQPGYICNHSDHQGRYAFDNQPAVALWNLQRLAQSLSGLIDVAHLNAALTHYQTQLLAHYSQSMRQKLGFGNPQDGDNQLLSELFDLMTREGSDYTRTFRGLCEVEQASPALALRDEFIDRAAFDSWYQRYRARLRREALSDDQRQRQMRAVNPALVLRNWLAQRAIDGAESDDTSELARLTAALADPFSTPDADLMARPPEWGKRLIVSCSS